MCKSQTFDEEPNCSAITVAQAQRRSIHQLRPNMARYQVQPIAKTTRKLQAATKISSTPAKATMCGPVSSFGPRRHNAAKTPRTSSFGPWNARPSSGQDEDSNSFGPKDARPPMACAATFGPRRPHRARPAPTASPNTQLRPAYEGHDSAASRKARMHACGWRPLREGRTLPLRFFTPPPTARPVGHTK